MEISVNVVRRTDLPVNQVEELQVEFSLYFQQTLKTTFSLKEWMEGMGSVGGNRRTNKSWQMTTVLDSYFDITG
jgi:hypothetical protein